MVGSYLNLALMHTPIPSSMIDIQQFTLLLLKLCVHLIDFVAVTSEWACATYFLWCNVCYDYKSSFWSLKSKVPKGIFGIYGWSQGLAAMHGASYSASKFLSMWFLFIHSCTHQAYVSPHELVALCTPHIHRHVRLLYVHTLHYTFAAWVSVQGFV